MKFKYLSAIIALFLSGSVFSQNVSVLVPSSNGILMKSWERKAHNAENLATRSVQALNLPFFDDFSYGGNFPSNSNWTDRQAFVNRTFPLNPTSIGVSTLDGLDESGYPYNVYCDPDYPESADTLTSQSINLSGQTSVFLYFQYEPGGLGDAPDYDPLGFSSDALYLEFLDDVGNWIVMDTIVNNNLPTDHFSEALIQINQGFFLHGAFQFRFRNVANTSGQYDLWHIDYVSLSNNNNNSFPDVAITSLPQSPLTPYTSMPINHFVGKAMTFIDTIPVIKVFNHSTNTTQLTEARVRLDETTVGTSIFNQYRVPGNSINPNDSSKVELDAVFSHSVQLDYNALDGLPNTTPARLRNTYSIQPNIGAGDFSPNNSCEMYSDLDNYFAYDDGTAEAMVGATRNGVQLAIEFKAEVADTIQGIYIHLPYTRGGIASNDFVNFRIWLDSLTDTATLSDDFIQPADFDYADYTDSLNAWWTYVFSSPVAVSAGQKFYVGWQQGSDDPGIIYVGYDKNNPAGADKFFENGQGTWEPFAGSARGSVMIRPVMSARPVYISSTDDVNKLKNNLTITPNPVHSELSIETTFEHPAQVDIFDMQGRVVRSARFQSLFSVGELTAGIYVVRLTDETGKIQTTRFIKE